MFSREDWQQTFELTMTLSPAGGFACSQEPKVSQAAGLKISPKTGMDARRRKSYTTENPRGRTGLCVTNSFPTISMTSMKSSRSRISGMFPPAEFFAKPIPAWFALGCLLSAGALPTRAAEAANALEIQSVMANGKAFSFQGKEAVSLGTFPENIVFGFGPETNAAKPPLRLRYRLEGYENTWHEAISEMALNVRFYNNSGDQISRNIYRVTGESTGWTGSLNPNSDFGKRVALREGLWA